MVDAGSTEQNQQKNSEATEIRTAPVAQTPASPAIAPNVEPRALEEQIGGENANNASQNDEQRTSQDSKMTTFERGVAIVGIGLGMVTAAFFYWQLVEMGCQTQILASQSEGANAGALMDGMNTRKQLAIAQTQATAALDASKTAERALEFQNRPWISLQNFRPTQGERVPDRNAPNEWRVTYDVVNTGYSPAVRVVVQGFVTINKGIYATFQREAPCREADRESADLKMPSLTVFRGEPISQDNDLNFREGEMPMINGFDSMVMCISYRDGSTNKPHHTEMLFRAIIHFPSKNTGQTPPVEKFVLQDAKTD